MALTGAQIRSFSSALRAAFNYASLRRMLRVQLGKDIEDISLGENFETVVFDLITTAERQGWTESLLLSAREFNPGSPELRELAVLMGLAPTLVRSGGQDPPARASAANLEQIIRESNSLLDLSAWREHLTAIEFQVCRLEINLAARGTAFLIGSDLLMTNYHVVEKIIQHPEDSDAVVARFDYKITAGRAVANPGREYRLHADWLVDYSPYTPAEALGAASSTLPQPDQLDYAILRLADQPGSAPANENADAAPPRGWIELSDYPYPFDPGTPLFIAQHPSGTPLKLALDTNAVRACNANRTRVTYNTNTEPGSSGSPVFNSDWQLVALHHNAVMRSSANEGIPTDKIVALLKQRDKWHLIGK